MFLFLIALWVLPLEICLHLVSLATKKALAGTHATGFPCLGPPNAVHLTLSKLFASYRPCGSQDLTSVLGLLQIEDLSTITHLSYVLSYLPRQ